MTTPPRTGRSRPRRHGDEGEPSVFTADEQHALPVEVDRWGGLARDALVHEGVTGDAELSLFFVDEATITELNRSFMGETGPTDVLAFPIDADDETRPGRSPDGGSTGPMRGEDLGDPPLLLGDVVICPSVANRNAQQRSIRFEDELALLVVHGVLHVLGHDHAEPEETRRMRERERELLDLYHREDR